MVINGRTLPDAVQKLLHDLKQYRRIALDRPNKAAEVDAEFLKLWGDMYMRCWDNAKELELKLRKETGKREELEQELERLRNPCTCGRESTYLEQIAALEEN